METSIKIPKIIFVGDEVEGYERCEVGTLRVKRATYLQSRHDGSESPRFCNMCERPVLPTTRVEG